MRAPENVRFKYQLISFDSDWVDAGTRRIAYYTALPPESYTFRVISGSEGAWNSDAASFAFELKPRFTQTYWFVALCVAVALAAILGLHQLAVAHLRRAVAHLRRRAKQMKALVAERTRELSRAMEEAESARRLAEERTRAKSTFLANIMSSVQKSTMPFVSPASLGSSPYPVTGTASGRGSRQSRCRPLHSNRSGPPSSTGSISAVGLAEAYEHAFPKDHPLRALSSSVWGMVNSRSHCAQGTSWCPAARTGGRLSGSCDRATESSSLNFARSRLQPAASSQVASAHRCWLLKCCAWRLRRTTISCERFDSKLIGLKKVRGRSLPFFLIAAADTRLLHDWPM